MYEKLPEQLKKDGRFCLWKYEERNGSNNGNNGKDKKEEKVREIKCLALC